MESRRNEMTIDVDAVIDLARYRKLWEDIHDQLVADSRAHEKASRLRS
jgi:hypothetical protein